MFRRRIVRFMLCFLTLVFMGGLGWMSVEARDSSSSIVIHMEDVMDLEVEMWQLNSEFDISDAQESVRQLDALSNAELSSRFGQPTTYHWQPVVTISNVIAGKYFIRQSRSSHAGNRLSPIVLEVKGQESSIEIIGKTIHPTTPEETTTSTTSEIPVIPETGNATLGYICMFGLSLFILGWIIVRKEQTGKDT